MGTWWCLPGCAAASAVTTTPSRPGGLKQVPQDRGPRFGLAGHPLLEQHRVRGVIHGRQRMRGRVSLVWAPRMVLPSTTTTLRPSMGPVPYVRP